jgi:hypothetical protein
MKLKNAILLDLSRFCDEMAIPVDVYIGSATTDLHISKAMDNCNVIQMQVTCLHWDEIT